MASLTLVARQYVNENKFDLAEQCYEVLLDYNRENEGDDLQKQPLTLSNLDELSLVYMKQEKWYQAESSLSEALNTRQSDSFIKFSPSVLESEEYMKNLLHLGKIYRMLNDYEKAISIFQKLMNLQKALLLNTMSSTDNTEYFQTVSELGCIYRYRGQFDLAEPHFLESLNGAISIYGHHHINTIVSKNNYANLLTDIKNYTDAEIIYKSVIESSITIYGEKNIRTVQYMNNLGLLYTDQDRKEDAHVVFEKCHMIGSDLLGIDHIMV